MEKFYKKKNSFTTNEIENFLNDNENNLSVEYLNFSYVILNPKNLIGVNEFNQLFFEKIDKIEVDLANGVNFEDIINNLNLVSINKTNYKFSTNDNEIEKKIFELRNNNFDIFEMEDDYILYQITDIDQRKPDIADVQTKNEILELMSQKKKFEYNSELLKKIRDGKFYDNEFLGLKSYIYVLSGAIGLNVATIYNSQRSPRLDESWYYRFYGIVAGLIFSSEFYEVVSTILTPSETFVLSQDEYEKNVK